MQHCQWAGAVNANRACSYSLQKSVLVLLGTSAGDGEQWDYGSWHCIMTLFLVCGYPGTEVFSQVLLEPHSSGKNTILRGNIWAGSWAVSSAFSLLYPAAAEALLRAFLGVCEVNVSSGHSRKNTEQAALILPTERSFSAKELALLKKERGGPTSPPGSPSSQAKQLSLKMHLCSCNGSLCPHWSSPPASRTRTVASFPLSSCDLSKRWYFPNKISSVLL